MTSLYIGREKEPERLAVIINTLPNNLGPENEFGKIGEVWERTAWKDEQIISLYEEIFPNSRFGIWASFIYH